MEDILHTLVFLLIALAVLLFFGPIIVIVSIIGYVEIGPLRIDLRNTGRFTRITLGVVGLAIWLSIYLPLISLASRGLISEQMASTAILTPTATVEAATPSPTLTSMLTPTETAIPLTDCIDSRIWTPYGREALPKDENGCWQLKDWGISARDGGFLMSVEPMPDERWHGIYTPLPPSADIQFEIRIEQLQTVEALNANVAFGIIDTSNFPSGKFVFYHKTSSSSPIHIALAEWGLISAVPLDDYAVGTSQQVIFSASGPILDIFIDGNRVAGPIDISSFSVSDKAFWIGYSLSADASLRASVLDFSVIEE